MSGHMCQSPWVKPNKARYPETTWASILTKTVAFIFLGRRKAAI